MKHNNHTLDAITEYRGFYLLLFYSGFAFNVYNFIGSCPFIKLFTFGM